MLSEIKLIPILLNLVITMLLTISAVLTLRKDNGNFTFWGRSVVVLAVSAFCVSGYQAYNDWQLKLNEPYTLSLNDIKFTLYAVRHKAYQTNEQILSDSPDGIPGVDIYIDGFHTMINFLRAEGVERPWGYRSLPRATLVYTTDGLRRHIDETDPIPFKHLWDLDSKKIWTLMPLHRFKAENDDEKWHFILEATLKNKVLNAEPSGIHRDTFEFNLTGIGKKELMKE